MLSKCIIWLVSDLRPPESGQFYVVIDLIKVDEGEIPILYSIILICFCCFRFFQANYPYAIKVNNFGSYPLLDPWIMPISYVFDVCHQVDEREILRIYFKHTCVVLLFLVFPGRLLLRGQSA